MIYDLQKGSLLKRASAILLDGILLVILATGFAFALSAVLHYGDYADTYSEGLDRYEKQFNIDFSNIIDESSMTDAEKEAYIAVVEAMNDDEEMVYAFNMMIRIIVLEVSVAIVLAYAVVEFIIPLILKNGQTIGKKIFGLGVMRTNGVRIRGVSLFIRTFMGKCVLETMIPVLVVMMIFFSAWGIMASIGLFGPILVIGLLVAQMILLFLTKRHTMIHDLVSDCVVVDLGSQMIFEDEQAMNEYQAKEAAREAAASPY